MALFKGDEMIRPKPNTFYAVRKPDILDNVGCVPYPTLLRASAIEVIRQQMRLDHLDVFTREEHLAMLRAHEEAASLVPEEDNVVRMVSDEPATHIACGEAPETETQTEAEPSAEPSPPKPKRRGRPPGSKNRPKD